MIRNIAWCLPRPRKDKYPGGFPLYFERRLLDLLLSLGAPRDMKILHPFGGRAEYGLRVDVNTNAGPMVLADAHLLPFLGESFDVVILDPPYSDNHSWQLYKTGQLHFKKYSSEAVRVLKPQGFLVMYHIFSMPRPPGCRLRARLLVETRVNHLARVVHINQKDNTRQLELIKQRSEGER